MLSSFLAYIIHLQVNNPSSNNNSSSHNNQPPRAASLEAPPTTPAPRSLVPLNRLALASLVRLPQPHPRRAVSLAPNRQLLLEDVSVVRFHLDRPIDMARFLTFASS